MIATLTVMEISTGLQVVAMTQLVETRQRLEALGLVRVMKLKAGVLQVVIRAVSEKANIYPLNKKQWTLFSTKARES